MKLHNKIVLIVVSLSFGINAFFLFLFISNKKKDALNKLNSKIKINKILLNQVNSVPLYDISESTLETNLKSFLNDAEIVAIFLQENSNNKGLKLYFGISDIDKEYIIDDKTDIFFEERKIGTIHTYYTKQNINKALSQSITQFFVLFFFLTSIISLVLYIFFNKITKPIIDLTELTTEIAEGNLDKDIIVKSDDEIGTLATSFIKMKNSIKKTILSLKTENEERKIAENELRKAKSYTSNIIDSMPSIIIVVDTDGKIKSWNKTTEIATGITTDSARGKYLPIVFSRINFNMDEILSSIHLRKIKKLENIIHEKEFDVKYEDVTIFPLISNGEEGAVIRIDDVTQRHLLEEQLNHSRKMDAIGQLAGGIAHDFNNMLAGILGAAQLLQLKVKNLDEKNTRLLDIIINSCNRAGDLTSKLLSFGRKGKIISTEVNVSSIIYDSMAILKRTIDKKIRIKTNENATNHNIIGDNSALQNCFMNLGINASHAMPTGGEIIIETKNIELSKRYCNASLFDIDPGLYLEIELRDTGCGISLENQKKIFEPFFTTKEKGKGTGLGLAAVYQTVQDHHGVISVYSEVNVGTVFHISLPCSKNGPKEKTMNVEIIQGTGVVLLVDDEDIIRITGQYMLKEMGYEVLLAENGLEALQLFKDNYQKIDLVIMDMIMPEMNGKEAFYKMKEIDKKCKIIISSGFANLESLQKMKDDGLADFIHKPYRDFELSKLMAKHVGKK